MFFKIIRLIKKNIEMIVDKHTVDRKQTYGPLSTNSYRLQTIDRMLKSNHSIITNPPS